MLLGVIFIQEEDLPGMIVGVDLEGDYFERVEGWWVDDWHVVGRHHRWTGDVGPSTDPQVRDP